MFYNLMALFFLSFYSFFILHMQYPIIWAATAAAAPILIPIINPISLMHTPSPSNLYPEKQLSHIYESVPFVTDDEHISQLRSWHVKASCIKDTNIISKASFLIFILCCIKHSLWIDYSNFRWLIFVRIRRYFVGRLFIDDVGFI
jgi:hypothetical protein